jgi:hypothetical protein
MLNVIFRALTRAGKAYLKKEDDDNALRYLHKLYQNIGPQKHKNYVMRYLVILSILI